MTAFFYSVHRNFSLNQIYGCSSLYFSFCFCVDWEPYPGSLRGQIRKWQVCDEEVFAWSVSGRLIKLTDSSQRLSLMTTVVLFCMFHVSTVENVPPFLPPSQRSRLRTQLNCVHRKILSFMMAPSSFLWYQACDVLLCVCNLRTMTVPALWVIVVRASCSATASEPGRGSKTCRGIYIFPYLREVVLVSWSLRRLPHAFAGPSLFVVQLLQSLWNNLSFITLLKWFSSHQSFLTHA